MADMVLPDWLVFRPRLFPSCKPSRRIGSPTMWAATWGLAERFGMPIAASAAEGSRVNAGDPESFGSDYLDQPVDPYRVDQLVEPGELLETAPSACGSCQSGGHSLGQVALFEERSRVLIAGDAILARDVAWINPFMDGAEALEAAIATVERIGPAAGASSASHS